VDTRSSGLPRNVLSLCAGVAGLDHGLRLACQDARPVCMVEGEAFCVACLVAQMQRGELAECPIWTDLTTFDGGPWRGVVDTVIAGFPCQPASVAGSRKGTDDERWLWRDVQRIIGEVEPCWVFLENVPGLLTAPGAGLGESDGGDLVRGGAMGEVLGGLAALGFAAEWCCVPASAVGSPQGRMRWFCLAHREVDRRTGSRSARVSSGIESAAASRCCGEPVGDTVRTGAGAGLPADRGQGRKPTGTLEATAVRPGDGATCPGRLATTGSVLGNGDRGGFGRGQEQDQRTPGGKPAPRRDDSGGCSDIVGNAHNAGPQGRVESIRGDADELPAWPPGPTDDAGWEMVLSLQPELAPALPTEPAFCRMADGTPVFVDNTARIERLRALGNCVVPAQAALAFRILWERMYRNGN